VVQIVHGPLCAHHRRRAGRDPGQCRREAEIRQSAIPPPRLLGVAGSSARASATRIGPIGIVKHVGHYGERSEASGGKGSRSRIARASTPFGTRAACNTPPDSVMDAILAQWRLDKETEPLPGWT